MLAESSGGEDTLRVGEVLHFADKEDISALVLVMLLTKLGGPETWLPA